MKHQIIRAQRQRALHFAAKRFDRLLQEQRRGAGEIHQIIHMDRHWLEVIFLPQAHHFAALRTAQVIRRPLTRAGRENLKSIAAQAIGALSGILHTAGARRMDANTASRSSGAVVLARAA